MNKINMFFILAFEEQTKKYDNILNKVVEQHKKGIKKHATALENHLLMLSKHFNLYNYYDYKHSIEKYDNPIIYHIPYGLDSQTGVEEELLKYKGKVPIIMRSYDPHSPKKTSTEYMEKYHDLTITYLNERVNGDNILFGSMCYDNYLMGQYEDIKERNKDFCMILRNRTEDSHNIRDDEFKKKGLNLRKIYSERERIVANSNVDIYGSGWTTKMHNYKGVLSPFDQKYSTLLKYKYNIILDNAIADSYVSEKILDSFLTVTVPVYLGSPTTSNQIDDNCYIDVSKYDDYDEMINYILNLTEDEYIEYKNNILKNRQKIFEEFSTRKNISSIIYNWYNRKYNTNLGLNDNEYDEIDNEFKKLKLIYSNDFLCAMVRLGRLNKQKVVELLS